MGVEETVTPGESRADDLRRLITELAGALSPDLRDELGTLAHPRGTVAMSTRSVSKPGSTAASSMVADAWPTHMSTRAPSEPTMTPASTGRLL